MSKKYSMDNAPLDTCFDAWKNKKLKALLSKKKAHIRIDPDNLEQIEKWIEGFRCKVSLNNAANMFMAEGIATIKKQGAK